MKAIFLALFILLYTITHSQPLLSSNWDSVCKYGKKYPEPKPRLVAFPAKNVSDDYKIKEIHKAVPDSMKSEDSPNWWLYNYYYEGSFEGKTYDWDTVRDTIMVIDQDPLKYKLKDTYFFDINGDGLCDFIHYPLYYRQIMTDRFSYDIFLQEKNGYRHILFQGFIVDISFNKDGTLDKMTTFHPACCDDYRCEFYYYSFDKSKNDLVETGRTQLYTCQLIRKK